jgi:hypothetical protein
MNFFCFFNAIDQEVLIEEVLKSLEKCSMKHYASYRCIFRPTFFDISVHLTTHLIKEIKLLGPVFLP